MGFGACPQKRRRHCSLTAAAEHSEAGGKEEIRKQ
ncbi:hypothetical protein M2142_000387 [Fusobacterium sp. PH5-29]